MSAPPMPPSLASRHQRLLTGARVIKSYVHESDQRREASRCAFVCALDAEHTTEGTERP